MKKGRLKVALDCDDVLYSCNEYALQLVNEKNKYNPPLSVNDIKIWGSNGPELDERVEYFNKPLFVKAQPLLPGAQKFVKELCQIAEVFITTAVPANCMGERAMRIIKDFPEISPSNIMIGERKDVMQFDVVLDDGSHNIEKSQATYPVLMRRPWNQNMSGILSVNTYEDFLHLVNTICNSYVDRPDLSNGGVVCLVGPSGSGKTTIMQDLIKDPCFEKPLTTTTRQQRLGEPDDAYRFICEKDFLEEKAADLFLETTIYSGQYYGTNKEEIDNIIAKNKYAIMPIDICGAIAIKNAYRNKAIIVFINRNRENVILDIIGRSVPDADKMQRIISLDNEYKNEILCDKVITNNDNINNAVRQIKEILK